MKLKKISFSEMKNGEKMNFSEMMKLRGGNSYGYGYGSGNGTCGVQFISGSTDLIVCNISKTEVDQLIADSYGFDRIFWCCDNCEQTGYCG